MKAVCWEGKGRVQVENVADPKVINPRDAILKITSTAICGSDLHLYDGYIPTMQHGDILGHEFMGEVVELGPGARGGKAKVGDRVVVPFQISCGHCYFCEKTLTALCDNSNPNTMAQTTYGDVPAALFGYSHMYGGYAGGQAEYARVPFADTGLLPIPEGIEDEKVLFLTDIFPTGFMAADNCDIQRGDTVAIWGCGPVGQFAIRSAFLLGAERVIAIDHIPSRLAMARKGGAETLNFREDDVYAALKEKTGGMGPDSCIDSVGLEAHGMSPGGGLYDRVRAAMFLTSDRIPVLRQMAHSVRKGGTLSIPGVYGGLPDKFPMGALFAKGVTLKMGQTQVHRYLPRLLEYVQKGQIDPSFVITHEMPLGNAADGYRIFHDDQDACIKVVLKPGQATKPAAAVEAGHAMAGA